ncbi:TetR/AcrR family transcriptional regulator [Paenibacillus sp. H1-7]|uniref:TetR/AcrR family transcriptional regulator n=1 Tax=Paenibacillus sp. H1-7 TaxID=2282849 RepID=UPI001EF89748|nr:TetR/AcrR family transcriptional regulator [Paenibacillus sp. H1-7]ULL13736.1 TetR/AcrR family transcriptional regulator [Paenibacillus sp. H1-7]
MEEQPIALRELKKARAKLALYEASLELIGEKSFRDVYLDDICRKAEVSKVTFFKFFRQKEDVLVYYMRVWLTLRIIELSEEPKRGIAAVRHLLLAVAAEAKRRPGLMLSLISFLSEMRMHPCMPELSEAEISLLFPEHRRIGREEPNLFLLFQQLAEEAEADGELREGITSETGAQLLLTIFYGGFLTAHLYQSQDVMEVYEAHLRLLRRD